MKISIVSPYELKTEKYRSEIIAGIDVIFNVSEMLEKA